MISYIHHLYLCSTPPQPLRLKLIKSCSHLKPEKIPGNHISTFYSTLLQFVLSKLLTLSVSTGQCFAIFHNSDVRGQILFLHGGDIGSRVSTTEWTCTFFLGRLSSVSSKGRICCAISSFCSGLIYKISVRESYKKNKAPHPSSVENK